MQKEKGFFTLESVEGNTAMLNHTKKNKPYKLVFEGSKVAIKQIPRGESYSWTKSIFLKDMAENNSISAKGINFLKKEEGGARLKRYKDGNGYSIGYGHFIKPEEGYLNSGITQEKAEELLKQDLKIFVDAVNKGLKVPVKISLMH